MYNIHFPIYDISKTSIPNGKDLNKEVEYMQNFRTIVLINKDEIQFVNKQYDYLR